MADEEREGAQMEGQEPGPAGAGARRGRVRHGLARGRPWPRRLRRASLGLALVGAGGWTWLARDPTATIVARRGRLHAIVEAPSFAVGAGQIDQGVRLRSTSGLEVELSLRRPDDGGTRPRPAVLLLGGLETGRRAVGLIPDGRGVVIAAISYPCAVVKIRGPSDVLAARRAILDTPAAVMLAMDYLCELPFVDRSRVELVGVSLGAPFACVAGGLDSRFARVWVVHGGGGALGMFDHGLKKEIGFAPARRLAAVAVWCLARGPTMSPEHWVGRVAPRPFVQVNAQDDARIPRACVDLLYESAGDPKERIWLPGGHVDGGDQEQVRALCELLLERIAP